MGEETVHPFRFSAEPEVRFKQENHLQRSVFARTFQEKGVDKNDRQTQKKIVAEHGAGMRVLLDNNPQLLVEYVERQVPQVIFDAALAHARVVADERKNDNERGT